MSHLIMASTMIAIMPNTHPVIANARGRAKAPAPTTKLNR